MYVYIFIYTSHIYICILPIKIYICICIYGIALLKSFHLGLEDLALDIHHSLLRERARELDHLFRRCLALEQRALHAVACTKKKYQTSVFSGAMWYIY